jgi:hypothetical protein
METLIIHQIEINQENYVQQIQEVNYFNFYIIVII